jgi:hypothetical protein
MGKKKLTLPMAILAPVGAQAVRSGKMLMAGDTAGLVWDYAGYGKDGKFYPSAVLRTYGPIAVGFAVHWMASKLGVNRAIAKAGVPIVRI